MLNTPLLSYLSSSPLPTIVFPRSAGVSPALSEPILSNFALTQLTRSQGLLPSLSPVGIAALHEWLVEPLIPDQLAPDIELELELELHPDGTGRRVPCVWRKTFSEEHEVPFLILVALVFPPTRLSAKVGGWSTEVGAKERGRREIRGGNKEPESLEQRSNDLELLCDRSAVGLARADLEGRLIWVNAAWWEITKHDRALPLHEWSSLICEEDYSELAHEWLRARSLLEPYVFRFRLKDGTYILSHFAPNNVDRELVTGWIMNFVDITQQVQAEETVALLALERERANVLESRRLDAEERRRQQELMIDVVSHEIRNPISAILNCADMTRASLLSFVSSLPTLPLPETCIISIRNELSLNLEAIDSIMECALAQERVANDTLGMAQISSGVHAITPVEMDVGDVLERVIRMFRVECRTKGINVTVQVGEGMGQLGKQVLILADPARLSQALINLVANAIRFTASSPVREITIAVELLKIGGIENSDVAIRLNEGYLASGAVPVNLCISVEDTGPGMTIEEAGRVFDRFMQASPLTHVQMGGSGLGLWIARKLCELHGGQIRVSSIPAVGSTFTFSIRAGLLPPPPTLASAPVSPPTTPPILNPARLPLRVLVVDDNALNRTILERQLGRAGHAVATASNGQEALEVLFSGAEFDCCIMDVEMPVLDGISATRALREAERTTGSRLRVVGCTGNAREAQVRAALDAGMDALCTKPYRLAQLLDAIAG